MYLNSHGIGGFMRPGIIYKYKYFIYFYAVICSIGLSGCANSIPSIPELQAREKWVGKPASLAFGKWGRPAEKKSTGDGQTQYIWHYLWQDSVRRMVGASTNQVGENAFETTHYYEDRLRNNTCDFYLTVDKQEIITAFLTLQNHVGGCSNFYWGNNRP